MAKNVAKFKPGDVVWMEDIKRQVQVVSSWWDGAGIRYLVAINGQNQWSVSEKSLTIKAKK